MFNKNKLICLGIIGIFILGFSSNLQATELPFPSRTGYWVQTGNNNYYCEWSFFDWICLSGTTSQGPPEESLPPE